MRRLVAILLLICCGIVIPAAAGQVRLCTTDYSLSVDSLSAESAKPAACCDECSKPPGKAPCCLQVEKLPAFTVPATQEPLPALVGWDAPLISFAPVLRLLAAHSELARHQPIRGPSVASAPQALFEVWRI
jgi:hypothetical protein